MVLFPAPLGPSNAKSSPRRTSRSGPSRTSRCPYRIRSPVVRIARSYVVPPVTGTASEAAAMSCSLVTGLPSVPFPCLTRRTRAPPPLSCCGPPCRHGGPCDVSRSSPGERSGALPIPGVGTRGLRPCRVSPVGRRPGRGRGEPGPVPAGSFGAGAGGMGVAVGRRSAAQPGEALPGGGGCGSRELRHSMATQLVTHNAGEPPTKAGRWLLPVFLQSGWRDLNPRPLRPERSALPSCATPRSNELYFSGLIPVCEIRLLWSRGAGLTWSIPMVIKGRAQMATPRVRAEVTVGEGAPMVAGRARVKAR